MVVMQRKKMRPDNKVHKKHKHNKHKELEIRKKKEAKRQKINVGPKCQIRPFITLSLKGTICAHFSWKHLTLSARPTKIARKGKGKGVATLKWGWLQLIR
jgi:hypothetical protein